MVTLPDVNSKLADAQQIGKKGKRTPTPAVALYPRSDSEQAGFGVSDMWVCRLTRWFKERIESLV